MIVFHKMKLIVQHQVSVDHRKYRFYLPILEPVDAAPDNFTRRIVEARNKKLQKAKQKQIVRSADFFDPLNAEGNLIIIINL